MMQYGSFLFLAVFLGLVCIGRATPLNVTAYQLRLSLLSESCRISDDDTQRFYNQRRQNDTRYNGFSGDEQLPKLRCFNLPNGGQFCLKSAYNENVRGNMDYYIIPYNLWRKGRRQPNQKDFHWCVYLLNTKYDIHVCLNVNGTYETTPAAEVLQLSSYFTVPPNTTGTGGGYMIIHHPDFVLDRAVVTCSVNMSTFTGISYHSLRLKANQGQGPEPQIVSFPRAGKEFLTLGETKNFSCEIIGSLTPGLWKYHWEHNGEAVTKVHSAEDLCNPLHSDNCTSTSYYTPVNYTDELSRCAYGQVTGVARNTLYLVVNSASANDTGNYTCVARDARTNKLVQSKSFFISVMFLDFPSNATLLLGENATLTCIVKATEGAMVQWLLDDQPLPLVEDSTACGGSNNSNSAVAVVSQSPLPGNFAIFHAELTICGVEYSHQGRFTCRVEASTDTEKAEMAIDSCVKDEI